MTTNADSEIVANQYNTTMKNNNTGGGDALKCGGKVLPRQIGPGGLGRKVMVFAHCTKKSSLGGNFWAENKHSPYADTANNSTFL